MQCPICSEPLGDFPHRGVRVSVCRACSGVWLDHDEILPYLDRAADEAAGRGEGPSGEAGRRRLVRRADPGFDGEVFCPRCNTVARPEPVGPHGVLAQRCVQCRGLWIERGRLERLAAWFREAPVTQRLRVAGSPPQSPALLTTSDFAPAVLDLLADDNPRRAHPRVTIGIIVANVAAFAWGLFHPGAVEALLLVPARFAADPMAHLPQLVASAFLHGGFLHLAGNMYFLWVFGDNLEDRIGPVKYLALYGFVLAFSGVCHAMATGEPEIPVLGASGAVAGVMGGYLALYPRSRLTSSFLFFFRPLAVNLPAWFYLGVWFFGMQVLSQWLHVPGIAWEAHIAGFVGGFAGLFILRLLHRL